MTFDDRISPGFRRAFAATCVAALIAGAASIAPAGKGPQLALQTSRTRDGGSALADCAHAVAVKGAAYYVAGYKAGESNGRNASLDKCAAALAWDGGYGHDGWPHLDDEFFDVALNARGEIYAAGFSNQLGRGRDIYLQKYMKNMQGAVQGAYMDMIGGDDAAHGVAIAKDGTVFAVGEATVPRAPLHVWLGKYDKDLGYITQATYSGPLGNAETGRAIAIDSNGDLIVAGSIARAGTGPDLWVAKFNEDLQFQSEVYVAGDGAGDDAAYGIVIDKKHRIWVVGAVAVAGQGRDVWLGGFDADLTPLGSVTRSVSAAGDDAALSVATDNRGRLFLAGRTAAATGGSMPWIGVFDTHFRFVTEATYAKAAQAAPADALDGANHIALMPGNTLLVVGGVTTANGGGDVWMAKYRPLRLPAVKKPW